MSIKTERIYLFNAGDPPNPPSSTQKLIENEPTQPNQVNLENVEDFSKVCRTCATVTEFVIPIFEGEGLQNNLADKIHKHLPIKVSEQDVLPKVVCYQCASTLFAWHELVQCCVQADLALRTRLLVLPDNKEKETKAKAEAAQNKKKEETKFINCRKVESTLINCFITLKINDDVRSMDYVCQKCTDKPHLADLELLTNHLNTEHNEISNDTELESFINEYVTFEEVLQVDIDLDDVSNDSDSPKKDIEIPRLFCPFCDSIFSSATRLICHLNKHIEICIDRAVSCCGITYEDKKSFVKHLQDVHIDRDVNLPNVCRSCGLIAEDAGELQTHILESHDNKVIVKRARIESVVNQKYIPAVCPECNKTFSNKYNMFVHMKSHGDQKFKCDKCYKSYKFASNLRNHKKVAHEGVLDYMCSNCGEGFPSRLARDVHVRIHSGIKPYTCQYCSKSYRAKNTLDRHIDMHLNVRKYDCRICSKKFRKKSHLDDHIKTHIK